MGTNKVKLSIIIPTKDRNNQLLQLLKSIKNSSYKNVEIIIVNNGEKISLTLTKYVKIVENRGNKGLAYARKKGAEVAKGEYLFFIDDDNVLEPNVIETLVESLDMHPDFIAVGPLTYYLEDRKKIWFAAVKMSLFTTKPSFIRSIQDEDVTLLHKRYLITDNLHNCFMLRKKDGDKVGWFDEKIFMNGTEFDLFQKIKRIRNGIIVTDVKAIDYHDVPTLSTSFMRSLGFDSEKRVYYFQRNRGLLVNRYGSLKDKLSLFFIFYPLFVLFYSGIFIVNGRFDFLKKHLFATIDGYKYFFKGGYNY